MKLPRLSPAWTPYVLLSPSVILFLVFGIELFYFAAFDEDWKVGAEGDVGAFWGLWDKDAVLKFGL